MLGPPRQKYPSEPRATGVSSLNQWYPEISPAGLLNHAFYTAPAAHKVCSEAGTKPGQSGIGTSAETKKNVIRYYSEAQSHYERVWCGTALHYGFWPTGDQRSIWEILSPRNVAAATLRENEYLAKLAEITSGDRVLDAGCGVGGSAIYLAQTRRCSVTGITLCPQQVDWAYENIARAGLTGMAQPQFHVDDYCQSKFAAGSFDVIWALESVCHAENKIDFCREAARLLAPGGRLIVADFFAMHEELPVDQKKVLDTMLKGWAVSNLTTLEGFSSDLHEAGFKKIESIDTTDLVVPSARRLNYIAWGACFLRPLFHMLGSQSLGYGTQAQQDNVTTARYQYLALQQKLWRYGVVLACK